MTSGGMSISMEKTTRTLKTGRAEISFAVFLRVSDPVLLSLLTCSSSLSEKGIGQY